MRSDESFRTLADQAHAANSMPGVVRLAAGALLVLLMLAMVLLTGCAAVSSTVAAVTPASVAATAPEPVSPATQRAYDDALRALRAGQLDVAERGFKALTVSNPTLGGPYANLGIAYRQANRLDDSRVALEKAVALNPAQPAYANQLGITLRHLGRFEAAAQAYERALASDPAYAPAVLNLGILCDLYLGQPQRALAQYDRYLALQPGGDAAVTKWVAELKTRKPAGTTSAVTTARQEAS